MSELQHQAPLDVWITVLGERYQAVFPAHGWTYEEARLGKQVSDGLAPVEIGTRFLLGDPDAVMAVIRVTLHRAGRRLTQKDLAELGQLNMEEISGAVRDAIEERLAEPDEDPPAPAAAGESTTPDGRSTSEEHGSPETSSERGGRNGTNSEPPNPTAAAASVTGGAST